MRRLVLGLFVLGPLALLAVGGACQDATQVTLKIALPGQTPCGDITNTSIVIGSEPRAVEARVATGDVTTKTSQCNAATKEIGTLVVTPGDSDRGALVIVVGYKGVDSASCKPPAYDGCIVVRRRFSFSSHAGLVMPITIDPACAGVACDDSTTCRAGVCFTSEVVTAACSGNVCTQPGELPDGGTNEAGSVIPDGGTSTIGDAAPDTLGPDANAPVPSCDLNSKIVCKGTGGSAEECSSRCCNSLTTGEPECDPRATCGSTRQNYCCTDSDCVSAQCIFPDGGTVGPGLCKMNKTSSTVSCNNGRIYCPDAPCDAPQYCCNSDPAKPVCSDTCPGAPYFTCCSAADCNNTTCEPAVFEALQNSCTAF